LGEPKYHRLGKAYALAGRPALSREAVKQAQELMEAQGLDVTVGG
jgi:hypothetical protein